MEESQVGEIFGSFAVIDCRGMEEAYLFEIMSIIEQFNDVKMKPSTEEEGDSGDDSGDVSISDEEEPKEAEKSKTFDLARY
jgi:hypothetical protein